MLERGIFNMCLHGRLSEILEVPARDCVNLPVPCVLYRALGQGAFGEVYQGFFRHRAGDAVEMPVAVKVCHKQRTGCPVLKVLEVNEKRRIFHNEGRLAM